jgi:uroporphyrinogen decarboxylase
MTIRNDRFLRALRREPVDCTPVWIMRQAGRYLPEYRATRARAGSFLNLAKNPELACEVTLQPLARFDLDAAILFSDILTVPDAMGLGLYFVEGEGPKFERPIRTEAQVAQLAVPDIEDDLGYVTAAVRLIRRELDGRVPLIGFSGSPWTLACYMVEGGGSDNFAVVKAMAYNNPAMLHRLLDVVTDSVIAYLDAQRRAGAQVLQIFDTWGGVLSPAMYREFSLPYLQRIAQTLPRGQTSAEPCAGRARSTCAAGVVRQGQRTRIWKSWRRQVRRPSASTGQCLAGRCTSSHRWSRGASGQSRSSRIARHAGHHPARSDECARELRQRSRPRLQPRSRHHAGYRPGSCQHADRSRARVELAGARIAGRLRNPHAPPGRRSGIARTRLSLYSAGPHAGGIA